MQRVRCSLHARPARPKGHPLRRILRHAPPLRPLQAFGKRKLRWKSIAKHFDKHRKDCRKQYTKLTGKEAPEGDE